LGGSPSAAPNGPPRRVSLDTGPSPGLRDGTWAALTQAEARQPAAALLRQAAAASEPDCKAAAGRIDVSYLSQWHEAATRGHSVLTDQPAAAGGEDAGMTPTDLLVASLSSCIAFYAGRYLDRHGMNRDGPKVTADFTLDTDCPARTGEGHAENPGSWRRPRSCHSSGERAGWAMAAPV